MMIAVVFSSGSCYYDNEEELYPEGSIPCDTVNVTFSGTVWPVINDNCYSCHSGASPSGNVSLENYDDVAAAGSIDPGQYGSLYGVITHHSGNAPMPKNNSKLSDCTIKQIEIWINASRPDN
jgi:hypothetical protein